MNIESVLSIIVPAVSPLIGVWLGAGLTKKDIASQGFTDRYVECYLRFNRAFSNLRGAIYTESGSLDDEIVAFTNACEELTVFCDNRTGRLVVLLSNEVLNWAPMKIDPEPAKVLFLAVQHQVRSDIRSRYGQKIGLRSRFKKLTYKSRQLLRRLKATAKREK